MRRLYLSVRTFLIRNYCSKIDESGHSKIILLQILYDEAIDFLFFFSIDLIIPAVLDPGVQPLTKMCTRSFWG
jgi:hypothetical protein